MTRSLARIGRCVLGTVCLLAAVRISAAAPGLEDTVLSPRSGPRGATMFQRMPPEQTGVVTENNYADPKMWTDHYQELIYGGIGTGVAIGDYDGDGRPDIFVVSKTESSRLFRNLGNWKFEDVTERAGLGAPSEGWADKVKGWLGQGAAAGAGSEAWKQGATFADVNNDGRLDLYVCRFGAPNLLFINRGDGTFSEEAAARGLAVVDGCGVAAFCDFDRDGWLDVYVQTNMLNAATHPNGRRDYLFHNRGDGTFINVTDQAGISGETAGHSATWWDYDGDGWPDLYVANDFAAPDRLYRNNRDGTFTDVINEVVPHMPYYAMGSDLGDVNNDGLIDLFVADMAPTTHEKDQRGMAGSRVRTQLAPTDPRLAPQYMRNSLYVNTGTGHMLEAAYMAGLPATDWTWSVRFEDLDNDGRIDLHVTNGMVREYHNADLLERLMAVENRAESRLVVKASPVLAESNLAFRNLGDLRFENVSAAWGLDDVGVSFGAAFGDLDGDGDLDLVYANYQHGVTMMRNDSDGGHRLVVALRGTVSNRFGVGATVRIETAAGVQVRQLVLARGYLSSSEPILHFGLGEETRIARLTVSWPSGHRQTFENLSADRRLLITEPAETKPGDKTVPATAPRERRQFQAVAGPAGGLAIPDDVQVEADFDRNGKPDSFVAGKALTGRSPLALESRLWSERNGTRVDVTDEIAPLLRDSGLVNAALWSDVDGDGWQDLLLGVQWGPVRYFHNREGRGFEDWTQRAGFSSGGDGWWSALAAADFNGDGRLDYVAGNLGLNTRYRANTEQPAQLFLGDFGGSSPMAVEAQYEGARVFPWLTRNELGARLPAIMRRFGRNDAYARATLTEILGEERLAKARRFQATEFRSGVFMSQPDGTYRFEPLPRMAQLAPFRAAVAGDLDGDGLGDIYAVQNSYAPPASVGRFDGGLSVWLRGDGKGHFSVVPLAESNLVVPGEGRAVALRDFNNDGWPDILVARGDGSTLAFQNSAVAGRKMIHVMVAGTDATAGMGTRIEAELSNGGTQIGEIHDGQAGVFFGYSAGNPLRRLRIRWPDGRTSAEDIPADATLVTLHAPK